MKRTLKFKLENDADLKATIREYNLACNDILKIGFKNKTWNKNKLHQFTYRKVRDKYPKLQSSLVCCARDHASDMLKREKAKRLPVKKENSCIRYNARTITVNLEQGLVSVSTINGRKKLAIKIPSFYEKYKTWNNGQSANIGIKNGRVYLFLVVEAPTPEKKFPEKIIGVDRGIINPVVCSDNRFFNSKEIRRIKAKYQYLRSHLQAKGTPSAERHLKRLSGREQRFMKDANHRLAKQTANSDADGFVLEDLKIRKNRKKGRKFNLLLGKWAYKQFQNFLEYKCEALGKSVLYVNPRHTSQTCSVCGNVKKSNRKGRNFKCQKCGFSLNADLNASRNIAKLGTALLGRLNVNQPIVTPNEERKFGGQLQADQFIGR